MPCSSVRIGNATAIICGRKRVAACCKCRQIAGRECDWKIGNGKTCDRPLCDACTHQPSPDKDLCPQHAAAWAAHPLNQAGAP